MAMKNKYAYRSRISEAKIRQLVKLFSVDLTASQIAELSGVNRNTVNRYVTAFRERIARYCEAESPVKGEVEVDESYFGARRVRGIRGRGARRKTIVFGLFKRNDNVYTEIVPDCSRATLQGIIRGRVDLESVIHSVVGEVMTGSSIWDTKNTSASSIRTMNFPINTHISMG
jgi:transposase-like protein